jgi:hypothetical protein
MCNFNIINPKPNIKQNRIEQLINLFLSILSIIFETLLLVKIQRARSHLIYKNLF